MTTIGLCCCYHGRVFSCLSVSSKFTSFAGNVFQIFRDVARLDRFVLTDPKAAIRNQSWLPKLVSILIRRGQKPVALRDAWSLLVVSQGSTSAKVVDLSSFLINLVVLGFSVKALGTSTTYLLICKPSPNSAIDHKTYFKVFSPLTPPQPTQTYVPAPHGRAALLLSQRWNSLICGFIKTKNIGTACSHSPGDVWSVKQGFCAELHTGLHVISQVVLISYYSKPRPPPSTDFIVIPIDDSTKLPVSAIVFHISVDRLEKKAGALDPPQFEAIASTLKF